MTANGGFEVVFHGQYPEMVPDEHIVATEIFEGMPQAEGASTKTFTETDGRTTLTVLVSHEPATPERTHQLRDGGRHAGSDGPP
jgi:uncharacterized protein YndB with AHSA1/START domain